MRYTVSSNSLEINGVFKSPVFYDSSENVLSNKSISNSKIPAIQILRGFAVITVVFYHVYLIASDSNYLGYAIFELFSEAGKFGVNLFFVLSGFIIFYAHNKDLGKKYKIKSYIQKRFTRIYPVYWFFLTCYILAAYFGLGHPDFEWSLINLFSSFMLVDFSSNMTLPLKVAWTLCYELIFYFMFSFFLYSYRLGLLIFSLWLLAILGSNFYVTGAVGYRFLELWNLNFIFGMASYYIYIKFKHFNLTGYRVALPVIMIAISIAGVIYSALNMRFDLTPLHELNQHILVVLAASYSFLILGTVFWVNLFSSGFWSLLEKIGDASYAIYLTHSAIISIFFLFVVKFHFTQINSTLLYVSCSFLALLGGYICHLIFEKPLVNVFRNWFIKSS